MLDGPLITAFSTPKAVTGRQQGRRLSEGLDNIHKYKFKVKHKYKRNFFLARGYGGRKAEGAICVKERRKTVCLFVEAFDSKDKDNDVWGLDVDGKDSGGCPGGHPPTPPNGGVDPGEGKIWGKTKMH